jgi:outer membrane protein TolC
MRSLPLLLLLAVTGCAVHPPGEQAERDRAQEAGRAFEQPEPQPPLPEHPSWQDYLQRAFVQNATLAQRYFEWRAALEQIPQDASPPNVALSFDVLFTKENMKLWDRTTLGLSNDPMTNIPFPSKLAAAGERALAEARVAGARFEAEKFALQRRVLWAYLDLAWLAEAQRLRREMVDLLRATVRSLGAGFASGGATEKDLLEVQTELDLEQNAVLDLDTEIHHVAVRLNALIGEPAARPVPAPERLPDPRPLPVSESDLLVLGAEKSPELGVMVREVQARSRGVDLAQQGWIPDFGLSASLTGSVERMLGAMVVLPVRVEAIQAGIDQAQASLRAAEQARLQYERDLAASFLVNLQVMKNSDRAAALFEQTLIPRARAVVEAARTEYTQGRGRYAQVLEAQRTWLSARLTLAQFRIEREKALAAIESFAAVDVEALPGGGRMP